MKPSVTLIIPSFNGEEYIRKTVDCVIRQSISSWEILIIDDCSTDSTYEIAMGYQAIDSRISVYQNDKNNGSARQSILKGVSKANTDWVVVMGQDDCIEDTYFERMLNRSREVNADIVISRTVTTIDGITERGFLPREGFDMNQVVCGKEACRMTIGSWKIGLNGAFIRKGLYENIIVDDKVEMNMDEVDNRVLLANSQNVAFCDAKYYYLIRNDSICRKISPKLFDKIKTSWYLFDYLKMVYPNDTDMMKIQWRVTMKTIKENMLLFWNYDQLKPYKEKLFHMSEETWDNLVAERQFSSGWFGLLVKIGSFEVFEIIIFLRYIVGRLYHVFVR